MDKIEEVEILRKWKPKIQKGIPTPVQENSVASQVRRILGHMKPGTSVIVPAKVWRIIACGPLYSEAKRLGLKVMVRRVDGKVYRHSIDDRLSWEVDHILWVTHLHHPESTRLNKEPK